MRKYIDRIDIDTVFFNVRRSNDKITGIYERILDIEPTSEKDIVKPYLEKLKKQIHEAAELYGIETIHVDALTNLIDNLLSE